MPISIKDVNGNTVAMTNAQKTQFLSDIGAATAAQGAKADSALQSVPIASATVLGGVKVGSGLAVAGDGTLSATGGGGGSSGGIVSVTADLTINAANAATYNGKTLSITSNVTITIAAGVAAAAPGFGFLVGALPATGGVNFIGSGGATINGLTTSVARTDAANPSGVSLYQSSTGDVYKLTGY